MKLFLCFCLFSIVTAGWSQHTSVMTYNIRYDNPDDGENAWQARKSGLVSQIRFHNPDVFGIQEGLVHQVNFIDSSMVAYDFIGQGRDNGRRAGEYCAIFYRKDRFESLQEGTLWLSSTPSQPSTGWDAALPRIASWVVLLDKQENVQFAVINTHFDHQGVQAREESVEVLAGLAKGFEAQGISQIILMGDLNATPEEAPIRKLQYYFRDSYDEVSQVPLGPVGTWCNWEVGNALDRRIDYIWVLGNVVVTDYAVLADQRPNGNYYSDHLPVMIRLRW